MRPPASLIVAQTLWLVREPQSKQGRRRVTPTQRSQQTSPTPVKEPNATKSETMTLRREPGRKAMQGSRHLSLASLPRGCCEGGQQSPQPTETFEFAATSREALWPVEL
jgi:hypothetical protein